MRLGEPTAERAECSALDVALDETQQALTKMISLLDAGWLEQLNAAEKISFWQKFETFRNRLPLIDHALIADAETTDLAGEYCFSNLKMLMTRRLQLSPAEAAARVRAAAAVGPRVSTQDEAEWPVLPQLAAAQRPARWALSRCRLWHGPCRNSAGPIWIPTRWRLFSSSWSSTPKS
jgi:Domain of unknown function (DUF222)